MEATLAAKAQERMDDEAARTVRELLAAQGLEGDTPLGRELAQARPTGPSWGAPPRELGISDAAITAGTLGGFRAKSDLAACLLPLLRALKWAGNPRQIAEALPHFADTLDITGLRNTMAQLGYRSDLFRTRACDIDPRLMPALFLPDSGPAFVALSVREREGEPVMVVYRSGTENYATVRMPRVMGEAYVFSPIDTEEIAQVNRQQGWFKATITRFRPVIWQLFATSLLSNVLALAMPMFVMAVYDTVIATGSVSALGYLLAGVLLAVFFDHLLRDVRARMIAYVGARLDNIVGNAIFERILCLPPSYTERATLGSQVARIKNFDTVRDFFTGSLATVALELPFMLLYLGVIFWLGGTLVLIPLLSLGIFAFIGFIMFGRIRAQVSYASRVEARRQEFLVETVSKMRALKVTGAEATWRRRYREMSARSTMANFHAALLSSTAGTLSHVTVIGTGLGTITFGVTRILSGDMTVGALIASMMLVWRVLGPLQNGFLALTQVEQVRSAIRNIDGLMGLKPEREPSATVKTQTRFKGKITFSRVSHRYSSEADPALVGVTFEAQPGEVVAVVGPNGAGKSTVLKLILGMYHPQAGNVRIDNIDIRQIEPLELRQSIGYVPQTPALFHGTVAQNLRLAAPTATDDDILWACDQADCLKEIEALPEGINTRVGDGARERLSASLVQRLCLARAYVQRSPIMLFDEPVNGLDFAGDRAFMKTVEAMRGHATVFLVTHRPSHLRLADQIVVLEDGYLRLAGPTDQVRDKIPQEML
ncbi:peptidase domain-containing ABC transporter [Pararhodospirillum oryzae]|uniref:ABC transporter n=1 Tax=Pararhodospirillum oryzae TaxID=478448 RepID=A0A512H5Z4_9PROT|nr:ATP-binding cassette domain-containing protein [Pararhodospirillum oryzae]GEO80895.1 hypothetical protein ROR02_10260 [Pararhodospirillum oryzae]